MPRVSSAFLYLLHHRKPLVKTSVKKLPCFSSTRTNRTLPSRRTSFKTRFHAQRSFALVTSFFLLLDASHMHRSVHFLQKFHRAVLSVLSEAGECLSFRYPSRQFTTVHSRCLIFIESSRSIWASTLSGFCMIICRKCSVRSRMLSYSLGCTNYYSINQCSFKEIRRK